MVLLARRFAYTQYPSGLAAGQRPLAQNHRGRSASAWLATDRCGSNSPLAFAAGTQGSRLSFAR